MQILVLVRHGASEGNDRSILTGQLDVPLTFAGRKQAEQAGQTLTSLGIVFDAAYTSQLQRARQTLAIMANQFSMPIPKVLEHEALNERDFGDYAGAIKTSLQREIGDTEYKRIVKGWHTAAPQGESLRDVHLRVVPYFQTVIMGDLAAGKNVIISSHHQTLRALIKHIEGITDTEIPTLFIENAMPIFYSYDPATGLLTREHHDFPVTT